jgi:two-component system, NtrC family, response regulator HydG
MPSTALWLRVALCRLDEITIEDLPTKVQDHGLAQLVVATESPRELITLDEMERRYIRHVLETLRGNKTRAARALGIDRRSLYRRLEAFEATGQPPAANSEPDPEPNL